MMGSVFKRSEIRAEGTVGGVQEDKVTRAIETERNQIRKKYRVQSLQWLQENPSLLLKMIGDAAIL